MLFFKLQFDVIDRVWTPRLRFWVQQAIKESEERLARERVLTYKLNAERTIATPVGFLTKVRRPRRQE